MALIFFHRDVLFCFVLFFLVSHSHTVLTDEDDQQQAGGVQLDVWVTEGVTEGGVDDHEEDGAADGAERRLSPLQILPEETSTHLHTHTHTPKRDL